MDAFSRLLGLGPQNVNAKRQFRASYSRAILLAGLAFAFIHGCQSLLSGNGGPPGLDPTAFLVLVPYEFLQFLVFAVVGGLVAYFPSRFLEGLVHDKRLGNLLYVTAGAVLGLVFLPLCAAFAFFVFPLPDAPSYLARCVEFALPMIAAGALGGYVIWRGVVRGQSRNLRDAAGGDMVGRR
jgi:hypothetical protein